MIFNIDSDNNITGFAEPPTDANPAEHFSSEKELAKLTRDWPTTRLVETWNSFAGVAPFDDLKPVKKFTDRKAAVSRIWKAAQRLMPTGAQTSAPVAPVGKNSKNTSTAQAGRATAPKKQKEPQGSRKDQVVAMLRRKQGATLADIMTATGWQAHTVRGFISGTVTKKLGLKVESFRGDNKARTYRTTA